MWFDVSTGNMAGAIMGSLLGVFGGTWGAIAGISAPKGKRRGMVMNIGKCLITLGEISLLIGIIALLCKQPYHVWYPFTLIGIIITASLLPAYFAIRRTYIKLT